MARTQDATWLETQYNNRARVPNHGEILARWARDSQGARAAGPCRLEVAYGASAAERLDIFSPPSSGGPARPSTPGAPLLVFIHGGWWRALDKDDHSFVAPALTAAGAVVVVPNYALCPHVGIEEIALQMTRSLVWCWRHATELGADPGRITVAGHSAGGHLAAMMLSALWPRLGDDLPPDLVKAALSVSGVFDLDPIRRTPFLQADLRLSPQSVKRLSPAAYPAPAGTLRAVAGALESEEFLRHNRLIRRRWGARAVPVCEGIPGADHFTVLDGLAQKGSRMHNLALQMLGLATTR
ncbi:MAG: alpha/beta hydrolase [Betaproteobacteria bacterium]|jgi:arylformamidase